MDIKRIKDFLQKADKAKLNQALSSKDPKALKKMLEAEDIVLTEEPLDYVVGGMGYIDSASSESY